MFQQSQSPDDSVVERAFWSGVTIAPPLYGADLPASFFDAKLPYGWNLRDLGDLLRTHEVPSVMGKTNEPWGVMTWSGFTGGGSVRARRLVGFVFLSQALLLSTSHSLPNTSGVTSPMTYFGMWRSFFGWHKEDADLGAINFLHM